MFNCHTYKKMMKYILLFLVLMPLICLGQTKRFYYEVAFKLDSINVTRDIVVLDINENENNFYSNEYLTIDSLNNSSSKFKFAYPKFKSIVKWSKKDNLFEFTNNLSMSFYQFNSTITLHWNLTEEKKKIGKYSVQKAVTNDGGRTWYAWFSTEIPFPFGPYVFYGLPGMILEVYDTSDDYRFSFIQNRNYDYSIESEKILKKYLGINRFRIEKKDWKKVQLNFYNNPISEYKNGDAIMLKNDGSAYTAQDYKDKERAIKEGIKKYNNPIEIDEKIDYK